MNKTLSASSQDYLETILELSGENEGVRVTDIANKMNIKKASVTQAINILADDGLVSKERYGPIYLTEKGVEEAEKVKCRHGLLSYFFVQVLGVDPAIADADACLIEHSLSPETFSRFAEFLETQGFLKAYSEREDLLRILDNAQD